MERGRGGGGRLTRVRARAHTHEHARVRHCHSNTRRRAAHTPVHTHALSPRHTHLQAKTPEQHTHSRLFPILTYTQAETHGNANMRDTYMHI